MTINKRKEARPEGEMGEETLAVAGIRGRKRRSQQQEAGNKVEEDSASEAKASSFPSPYG